MVIFFYFDHIYILYQSTDIFSEHPDNIKMNDLFFLSLLVFFLQQIRLQLECY